MEIKIQGWYVTGQPEGFAVRLFCVSLWIREEAGCQGQGFVSTHEPKQVPKNQENAGFAKFLINHPLSPLSQVWLSALTPDCTRQLSKPEHGALTSLESHLNTMA